MLSSGFNWYYWYITNLGFSELMRHEGFGFKSTYKNRTNLNELSMTEDINEVNLLYATLISYHHYYFSLCRQPLPALQLKLLIIYLDKLTFILSVLIKKLNLTLLKHTHTH